jgi:hypothetical protein
VQQVLTAAVVGLSDRDRQLLEWRFVDNLTIVAMAPRIGIAAKPLYRHFSRVLRRLRLQLESAGVDIAAARMLLDDLHGGLGSKLFTVASQPLSERAIA